MATGGMRELAEDLECPVCMGELDQPKVLQCRHVFCAGCLEKWLDGLKLVCPVCRYEQVFTHHTDISKLPEPLILSKLQEKITKFLASSQDTGLLSKECGLCGGKAGHFCVKCVENLCDTCVRKHKANKLTKGHKLTPVTKWTTCSKHPSKFRTIYCTTCHTGVCSACLNMKHSDHEVLEIDDKDLINEKVSILQTFKKSSLHSGLDFTQYQQELKKYMTEVNKDIQQCKRRLENFRREMNKSIDDLQEELDQHLAAEQKKLSIHHAEIEDMRATRESLMGFIEDVLQRNSAPEIVIAADELPDISTTSVPVHPRATSVTLCDTKQVIQSVKNLLDYNAGFISSNIVPHPIKASDAATHPIKPTKCTVVKSKKKGTQQSDSNTFSLLKRHIKYTKKWEIKPSDNVQDVLWDKHGSVWWIRTGNLYKYDADGQRTACYGEHELKGWGHLCADTKRDYIVTTDAGERVVVLTKLGELVKQFSVPGSSELCGITYCSHRDVYVVSDDKEHCLSFIDSSSGQIQQKLGSKGNGNNQFNDPFFICHQTISSDMCHIIVSDCNNDCIKVFSQTGEFIRRFGSYGTGKGQLQNPRGVCVDPWGRIIVCDRENQRVVCFWWDEGEKSEVLLTRESADRFKPWCVTTTHDGKQIVIGCIGGIWTSFYAQDI